MATPANAKTTWMRGLRPVVWWLLLVVVLFVIHTHQRLSPLTRLTFSPSLQGHAVAFESSARFDGNKIESGNRIPLGWHTFTISHPKAVPFSTNLFVWYGEHNLGNIALARSTGTLSLEVHPAAKVLTIRGPEFSTTLTNSTGLTSSVPTDPYLIHARYDHWQENKELTVFSGQTNTVRIAPSLGDIELWCNQPDATFKLSMLDKATVEGRFPGDVSGLPTGTYQLIAEHHRNRQEKGVVIKAGETNMTRVEFVYGAAVINTEPTDVTVTMPNGTECGKTPLTLPEMLPGVYQLTLDRSEYESMDILLTLRANETNFFHTNLLNTAFVNALARGETALTNGKLSEAVIALTEALKHSPGEERTSALLRQARISEAMESAEARASAGDHRAALEQVQIALALSPDLERAKQLQSEYEKVIAESEIKARKADAIAAREAHPKQYFDRLMLTNAHSALFDEYTAKGTGKLSEIQPRLVYALTNESPTFKLVACENPDAEIVFISMTQGVSLAGRRRVDLVAGQVNDSEVIVIFKVFEYALPVQDALRAVVKRVEDKDMLPVHNTCLNPEGNGILFARRVEGVRMVRERIEKAVGATP
jgi:hypothetical protein